MDNFTILFKYNGRVNKIEYKAKSREHARRILPIKLGHSITDLNNVEVLEVK